MSLRNIEMDKKFLEIVQGDPNKFMSVLEQLMNSHPLLNHDFLRNNQKYLCNIDRILYFAHQLKHYVFEFPHIFAKTIGCIEDEVIRVAFVENLFEEHGEGNLSKTHPALYKKFLNQLPAYCEEYEPIPEVRSLIGLHYYTVQSANQFRIVGFLLGNEYIAPPILSPILV